jgi:Terminase large subunit, T4likevirus-type, N-terminal
MDQRAVQGAITDWSVASYAALNERINPATWHHARQELGLDQVAEGDLDGRLAMTLDDVGHYSAEEKKKIAASYAPHEREARVKGIPTLGSGRIFPVPEATLAIEHREFPAHWPRIGGMDFGWDHPFAAVELVWDRDDDCVYVSKTYRIREATPIIYAAALRSWKIRFAWPRDGRAPALRSPISTRHGASIIGPRAISGWQRERRGRNSRHADQDAGGRNIGCIIGVMERCSRKTMT